MPSELFANVLRCRRMARQIGKHGAALIEAALGVTLAEHDLIARLMETSHEGEFAAMNRLLGSQLGYNRCERRAYVIPASRARDSH